MDQSILEALATSTVVYSDAGSEITTSSDFTVSSPEGSPEHIIELLPNAKDCRMVMNDKDKSIYNSLGSSSSPLGKLTYSELGLEVGYQKRGVMSKTGPCPSWYTVWKRRLFVLKGNFLYYFEPKHAKALKQTPVLGAIYLKNSVIEKVSMPFAKKVVKITPPVPRRKGWEDSNESCIFYISFHTDEGRTEWYEELQQVAFDHDYPSEKDPLINTAFEFTDSGGKSYPICRFH